MPTRKPPKRRTSSRSSQVKYTKFSDKLSDSLEDITKMIDENKEMIDSVQEVALGLTSAMGTLHELTVKYAGIANAILDVLLPIIKNVPIIPDKVEDLLIDLERITQKIIDEQEKTSQTIKDVDSGLKTGDVNKLKDHAGDLEVVTKKLTAILPKK